MEEDDTHTVLQQVRAGNTDAALAVPAFRPEATAAVGLPTAGDVRLLGTIRREIRVLRRRGMPSPPADPEPLLDVDVAPAPTESLLEVEGSLVL